MDAISDTESSDDSARPIQCIVDYTGAPTLPVRYMLMYAGRIDRCNAVRRNNTSRVASLPTTKPHGLLLKAGNDADTGAARGEGNAPTPKLGSQENSWLRR